MAARLEIRFGSGCEAVLVHEALHFIKVPEVFVSAASDVADMAPPGRQPHSSVLAPKTRDENIIRTFSDHVSNPALDFPEPA